jgi:hypothetical protein
LIKKNPAGIQHQLGACTSLIYLFFYSQVLV